MKYYEFLNSVKILAGENALENLPYELKLMDVKNPLILTDSMLIKLKSTNLLFDILDKNGINNQNVYFDIPVDSSVKTINDIVQFFNEYNCDSIIALGGGSVIDTAKCVKLSVSQHQDNIERLIGNENVVLGDYLPFIVLPTTCGTGSECTSVAVIKNKNGEKIELITSELLPNVAVLEPRLIDSLPNSLLASTCVDALSHAIEAYCSRQKNPISDSFALSSIKLISHNIYNAIEKNDLEAKTNLLVASNLAGIAFSNSMVGVVHALAHSLGTVAKISHSNSVSILLVEGLKYNLESCKKYYAEMLFFFAGCDYLKSIPSNEMANEFLRVIEHLLVYLRQNAGLKNKLTDFNIGHSFIQKIAEVALNDGAVITNIKNITKNDVLKILENCIEMGTK